jgi:hypothetical protein
MAISWDIHGIMRRTQSEVMGKVPVGATHWSVRRKGALSWEWCTFAGDDGVARQEFPISTLTVECVRDRWGSGTYRIMFVAIGRGVRQVSGNGKIFELTAAQRGGTPRPTGRAADADAPEDHSEMVRVLLKAANGKTSAAELYETLAVPLGMGLSSLFAGQDRMNERLDAIERRMLELETSRPAPRPTPPQEVEVGASRLDRLLDRLESIEGRLERATVPRKASPSGRRTPR